MQTNQRDIVDRAKTTTKLGEEIPENRQPQKRVYLFYDAVPEEQLLAELEGDTTRQQEESEARQSEKTTRPLRPTHRSMFLRSPVLVFAVCLFLLLSGGFVYLFFQTVTVTIIAASKQVETSGTITLVSSTPDTTQNQIQGRLLPSLSMSQTQSAATTGITHQPARPGRGIITFYNDAQYPQTIPAGFHLTGTSGVVVTTEYSVTVPGVAYPTLGHVSVVAHAIQTGTAGNITAGDIYGDCCLLKISAVNSAFTGGQEAATYQSVSQADIDATSESVKKSLMHSVAGAMQTELHPDEALVSPLPCQPTISADHQPGERASLVHVTLSESCTGIAYTPTSLQTLLRKMQTQAGNETVSRYSLTGEVHAVIQTATTNSSTGETTLRVQTRGTWVYHFSQREQQYLASQIIGMSMSQATEYLSHIQGIKQVSITNGVGIMPCDPKHIRFVFLVQQ